MRVGVITFPGTLDDVDAARAVRLAGAEAVALWHADRDLRGVDAVVVPGGFSYGDYLRAGAIAARAPLMQDVVERAKQGLPVLGICNGFQVLCEAGLLPGALTRNSHLHFRNRDQVLTVERSDVQAVSARSTTSTWSRLRKCRWLLRVSAPGSRPASQSTWKPLQMPSTGRPSRAPAMTDPIAGEKREMAPQRR